jgi:hypothetical protein
MTWRTITWPLLWLLLVPPGAPPPPAHAAMVKLTVPELAARADTVVVGTVVDLRSAWNAEQTAIHSDVTVAVDEVVKGTAGRRVTFRIRGGEVGGIGMSTSVDPTFGVGERVVVFLDTTTTPATLTGLRQGKASVRDGLVRRDGKTHTVQEFVDSVRSGASR